MSTGFFADNYFYVTGEIDSEVTFDNFNCYICYGVNIKLT